MKKMFAFLLAVMSVGFTTAYAQSLPAQPTLQSMAQFGTKLIDLDHARIVDLTPGAQSVTDANGVVHTGSFVNDTAFTGSIAFSKYVNASATSYKYYNLSMTTAPYCSGGTVLNWNNGPSQTLPDSCVLFNRAFSYGRR